MYEKSTLKIVCPRCAGYDCEHVSLHPGYDKITCTCTCGYNWDICVQTVIHRPPVVSINTTKGKNDENLITVHISKPSETIGQKKKALSIRFNEEMMEECREAAAYKLIDLRNFTENNKILDYLQGERYE